MFRFFFLAVLFASTTIAGESFSAKVTNVVNGDTVKVRANDGTETLIRFGEVDAP